MFSKCYSGVENYFLYTKKIVELLFQVHFLSKSIGQVFYQNNENKLSLAKKPNFPYFSFSLCGKLIIRSEGSKLPKKDYLQTKAYSGFGSFGCVWVGRGWNWGELKYHPPKYIFIFKLANSLSHEIPPEYAYVCRSGGKSFSSSKWKFNG